jgi:small subunit ribosomal protein S7
LVDPDLIYNSRLVNLVINRVLKSGKKSLAQRIVYGALMSISLEETIKDHPILVLEKAVRNATPRVLLKKRRFRGATYPTPVEARLYRRTNVSIKWILEASKSRPGKKGISEKLSNELISASKKFGGAIRQKEQLHKIARKNKVFARRRRRYRPWRKRFVRPKFVSSVLR